MHFSLETAIGWGTENKNDTSRLGKPITKGYEGPLTEGHQALSQKQYVLSVRYQRRCQHDSFRYLSPDTSLSKRLSNWIRNGERVWLLNLVFLFRKLFGEIPILA